MTHTVHPFAVGSLLLLACSGDRASTIGPAVRISALQEETLCGVLLEPNPEPIGLDCTANAAADGTFLPDDGGNVSFVASRLSPGELSISMTMTGQGGQWQWSDLIMVGDRTRSVDMIIPVGATSIPDEPTDVDGHAVLRATLDAVGGPRRNAMLEMWFHHDGDRWLFYDGALRSSSFHGGRLTERARDSHGDAEGAFSYFTSDDGGARDDLDEQ